jgi:hypothetical protein
LLLLLLGFATVFTGFCISGWNFGIVLGFLSTFAAAVIDSTSSSLDSSLRMRRFLVGRPSSSCGGGRLLSVFLPTKDGALNGFMKPMLGLDLFQIYRWTNASLDVVSTGNIVRSYFWQSRAR